MWGNRRRQEGCGSASLIIAAAALLFFPGTLPGLNQDDPVRLLNLGEKCANPQSAKRFGREALALLQGRKNAAFELLARANYLAGQLPEAFPFFQKSMKHRPSREVVNAFIRYAADLDRAGLMERCTACWQILATFYNHQPWTVLNLAIAYRHAGQYAQADKLLALSSHGETVEFLNERALVWKGAGQRAKAEKILRRAVDKHGKAAGFARLNLAMLFLDRGVLADAKALLSPDPMNPPGALASLLMLRSRYCKGLPPF